MSDDEAAGARWLLGCGDIRCTEALAQPGRRRRRLHRAFALDEITGTAQMTTNPLSEWARAVHAYSIDTGNGITPQEAVARFGAPLSNTPSSILYSAMRTGWFRREQWEQPSKFSTVKCSRYFALVKEDVFAFDDDTQKEGAEHQPPVHRTSSFYGLKRVRWVFDLGAK